MSARTQLVHLTHVASGKKYVTYTGVVIGGLGTVLGALSLDSWAHAHFAWLPAAGIAGTSIGGVLATFGRGISDRRPVTRVVEQQHTAERDAVAPTLSQAPGGGG